MSQDVKEKYFALAREVDAEHKRKYPGEFFSHNMIIISIKVIYLFN